MALTLGYKEGKIGVRSFFDIRSFEAKLQLFSKQLSEGNPSHFHCCGIISSDLTIELSFPSSYCVEMIELLKSELKSRFCDFHNCIKEFHLFQNPFEVDVEEAPQLLQLELIDLQASDSLKDKYKKGDLVQFYSYLLETTFPHLKAFASEMISVFGSTVAAKSFCGLGFLS